MPTVPITGVRFKCRTCPDFDLCEACEAKNVHPADHPMVKFKVEKVRHHGGHHGGRHGGHGHPHPHPLHKLFQAFRGGQVDGLFPRHHGWPHRSRWLSRGAVGDAVKQVQQALKIQVDGFFGAKTEQAVKEFQTTQSLEADGIVGPRTRAKLMPDAEKAEAPVCGRQWWLTRGAVGDAVKEIQQMLGIQADGIFGARTEQAVKEFQAAHSLDADGIVGPRTRAEITRVQPEKKDSAPIPQVAPIPQAAPVSPVTPQPVPVQAPTDSPAMTQLINMGFPDVSLNAELLKKHKGDVEQVVAELIGA